MPESRADYTTAELAAKAGVSTARIRQLAISGAFPNARKRASAWFIPAEEADAWLKERQGEAGH